MTITAETRLVGLFGYPVGHSLSPAMHNAAFAALGLNLRYVAFPVPPEHLADAVRALRALSFRGVNVTIPHKVAIVPFLDALDEEARAIGAVNTVIVEADGRLVGTNTDGRGYVRSLLEETGVDLAAQRVLILGAGGAARAVAISLARCGAPRIAIANRTPEKAAELAAHVASYADAWAVPPERLADAVREATLLVNTTSVGMVPHADETPLPPEWLHDGLVVSDLVYRPLKTRLLREAEARGLVTHGGLGMLIHQGALAFERWTGRSAPVALMRDAALRALAAEKEGKDC
ncbi:MAG TPA: shikimate dehydrogenase [Calditerricola sp.]